MPSVGATINGYRIVFIVITIIIIYIINSLNTSLADQIARNDEILHRSQLETESLSEKLRVIWTHKKKIQTELDMKTMELSKYISRMKFKESDINGLKLSNNQCNSKLSECLEKKKQPEEKEKDTNEIVKQRIYDEEMKKLNEKVKRMEEEQMKKNIENKLLMDTLKDELDKSEKTIKQLTGGGAIDQYTQNETAHFHRDHKQDEPLSFDRGQIQQHLPVKLLRGKELAETIDERRKMRKEKEEEMNIHPQDRPNKDKVVNEQPDENEEDYKEH